MKFISNTCYFNLDYISKTIGASSSYKKEFEKNTKHYIANILDLKRAKRFDYTWDWVNDENSDVILTKFIYNIEEELHSVVIATPTVRLEWTHMHIQI